MSSNQTKFWLEDPCVLLTDLVFLPTSEMTKEEKLNALTRLAIIIGGALYLLDYENALMFIGISVGLLVVAQYAGKKSSSENFSIVPTYLNSDFQAITVAPTFAEEHRLPPPSYDQYTSTEFIPTMFEDPSELRPQSYPYGQYLTKTNTLPCDETDLFMNPSGGARTAREYWNSQFTKNDIAFRENLMGVYKKKLNRRFRHSTNDTISPYSSY